MTKRHLLEVGRAVLAVALLGAALLMWKGLPTKLETWAPIAVPASVGERAVGRDLAVTVHRVDLAKSVRFQQRGVPKDLPTQGCWLVFSLSYEPLHDNDTAPRLRLVVSGRNYESNLGGFSGGPYPVGVAQRGVAAFELPEVPEEAVLQVANRVREKWGNPLSAPLDSEISLTVDVSALNMQPTVDLDVLAAA